VARPRLSIKYVSLEMLVFGFQIGQVSGPGIIELGSLNGPKLAENPLKMVGWEAPHHFERVLDRFRPPPF